MQGAEYNGSNSTPSGYYNEVIHAGGNGAGKITFDDVYADIDGTYYQGYQTVSPTSIAFDSNNPGRATITPGNNSTIYLYFFNTNNALWISHKTANGNTDSGWLEGQSLSNFSDSAVAGTYMIGSQAAVSPEASGYVGQVMLGADGSAGGILCVAGKDHFAWEGVFSSTYNPDTSASASGGGYFILPNSGNAFSCLPISSTKSACTLQTYNPPIAFVLQK
jgi:hypothetical protein